MAPELVPPASLTPETLPLLGAADPAFLLPSALPAGPCVRSSGGACCRSCVSRTAAHEAGDEGTATGAGEPSADLPA
ncbi:MAG: hypothetical protein ABJF88_17975 [Rhodothermales bacterium]